MAASTAFRLTAVGLLIFCLLNRHLHPVIGVMSREEVSDGVGLLICLMLCYYLGFYAHYRRRCRNETEEKCHNDSAGEPYTIHIFNKALLRLEDVRR